MKKAVLLLLCIFCLVGCSREPDHLHSLSEGENQLKDQPGGYCGNTITRVSCNAKTGGWEDSFSGSDSVALTHLLRYLDYSEEICSCVPEYIIDTEFGQGYGCSLKDGYVRYQDKQVSLTAEQVVQITAIIERNAPTE